MIAYLLLQLDYLRAQSGGSNLTLELAFVGQLDVIDAQRVVRSADRGRISRF